jgi:hypothetical protein
MKLLLSTLICVLAIACAKAQDMIEPGSKSINPQYLQPRNVFEKLSSFDSTGKLTGQGTLNLVTRIDSNRRTLTYLQIRNDGKKDSTVMEWPSLRPLYSETFSHGREFIFDYRAGATTRVSVVNNGKKESDTTYAFKFPFFDFTVVDYLLGSLPLQPGYHGSFKLVAGGSDSVTAVVKDVFADMLLSGDGHAVLVNLVLVEYNGLRMLYWIDKATGEILKSVFQTGERNIIVKAKI